MTIWFCIRAAFAGFNPGDVWQRARETCHALALLALMAAATIGLAVAAEPEAAESRQKALIDRKIQYFHLDNLVDESHAHAINIVRADVKTRPVVPVYSKPERSLLLYGDLYNLAAPIDALRRTGQWVS